VKTAISIPDALFREAEAFAKRRSLSRSELYATAVAEYLQRQNESKLAESFDAAYAEGDERDAWGDLGAFRARARTHRGQGRLK
jgi:predicted transcriptional regulator